MEGLTVSLAAIDVPEDRARDFDPVWAEALAAMIAEQGLLQPVVVRPMTGGRYALVAGLHRLRALERLGRRSIPIRLSRAESDAQARLDEVMENLGRQELVALDRCRHLWELKRAWEALHPEAKHGGKRPGAGRPAAGEIKGQSLPFGEISQENQSGGEATEVFGFARAHAERIGLSQRAIKLAVTIWTRLTPSSRRRLAGTDLATKQTELKALSELSAKMQEKVLDLILGEADVWNVAGALLALGDGMVMTPVEKRYRALCDGLRALPDPVFDQLLEQNIDRVLAALKRTGRL